MTIRSGKVGARSDGDYDYMTFWIECDKCHKSFGDDGTIVRFKDAVSLKKSIGFKSLKINGRWYEYCPECVKRVDAERKEE